MRRRGFTLLELMLVLGVIVAVLAMAAPMLHRSFSYQTLKSGADQVRAAFTDARAKSIKTGNVYAFLYSPKTDIYTIAPFINSYSIINPEIISTVQNPPPMQQLPRGIQFVGAAVSQDARAQFESEDAPLPPGGMTPILFYPDGTSQDASLVIINENGELIRVDLRGLTGLSSTNRMSTED